MNSDKLIEKEKEEQEAIKKAQQEEEIQEEREELESIGVETLLRIRDGGNIYSDKEDNHTIKRVIIDFKNEYYHLEFEIEVDSLCQQIDSKEFWILYGFYLDFLNPKSYKKLIDALNSEIPKLFI